MIMLMERQTLIKIMTFGSKENAFARIRVFGDLL